MVLTICCFALKDNAFNERMILLIINRLKKPQYSRESIPGQADWLANIIIVVNDVTINTNEQITNLETKLWQLFKKNKILKNNASKIKTFPFISLPTTQSLLLNNKM